MLLQHGHYPWPVAQYAEAIQRWAPDVAWTMDYPCEPSVRLSGRYDPRKAQEMTNTNTRLLMDLGADVSSVVQGWELPDYLANVDLLKRDGLLTPHLGIGSVCRRGKSAEIRRIITAVRKSVPAWVKLHGFGVKMDALTPEVRMALHSADSSAWAWGYSHRHYRDYRQRGRHEETKEQGLQRYIDMMEPLLNEPTPMLDRMAEA